jgi:hypothetical protein
MDIGVSGNSLVISIGGTIFLIILLVSAAIYGWRWGVRSFLTVTLGSILAYLFLVEGGNQVLTVVNNIYSNIPRMAAVLTGDDVAATQPWGPLVPAGSIQLPLFLRFVLFLVFVAVAIRFNSKSAWYKEQPADDVNRGFGAFTAVLVTLIWISAATTFWLEYAAQGGSLGILQDTVNALLGTLPDVSSYVPFFILGFMLFIVISLLLRFPKLLKP